MREGPGDLNRSINVGYKLHFTFLYSGVFFKTRIFVIYFEPWNYMFTLWGWEYKVVRAQVKKLFHNIPHTTFFRSQVFEFERFFFYRNSRIFSLTLRGASCCTQCDASGIRPRVKFSAHLSSLESKRKTTTTQKEKRKINFPFFLWTSF